MPLRVRKLTDRYASGTPIRKSECLYFGDSEIYREYSSDGTTVKLQRTTDHISDEHGRFAMQERTGTQILLRYNHADPLESSRLETDSLGRLIAYEEYHAYGTTAYQATLTSLAPGARRYRYAGKERDEESGLYYFGARYYAPWLGRFLSVDPKAGEYIYQSTYCYAANNPVTLEDVNGEGAEGNDSKDKPTSTPKPYFGGIMAFDVADYLDIIPYGGSRAGESSKIGMYDVLPNYIFDRQGNKILSHYTASVMVKDPSTGIMTARIDWI
ncbi:RHS repeat-associated core domain-containing protein [Nostoc sp. NIES-2111]